MDVGVESENIFIDQAVFSFGETGSALHGQGKVVRGIWPGGNSAIAKLMAGYFCAYGVKWIFMASRENRVAMGLGFFLHGKRNWKNSGEWVGCIFNRNILTEIN